jgi:hypothetical protein
VAVTIWRLVTNIEYRTIGALFGLGHSTVGEIVLDTCEFIVIYLLPKYIRVPKNDSIREIVYGFEHKWGFPQTVGANDGTHIPIIRPLESASDYYNRKGYYSISSSGISRPFHGCEHRLASMMPGNSGKPILVLCFLTGNVLWEVSMCH